MTIGTIRLDGLGGAVQDILRGFDFYKIKRD
jgi:hypothetical protein